MRRAQAASACLVLFGIALLCSLPGSDAQDVVMGWQQCGGIYGCPLKGSGSCGDAQWPSVTCAAGYVCKRQNEYYWQCAVDQAAAAAAQAAAIAAATPVAASNQRLQQTTTTDQGTTEAAAAQPATNAPAAPQAATAAAAPSSSSPDAAAPAATAEPAKPAAPVEQPAGQQQQQQQQETPAPVTPAVEETEAEEGQLVEVTPEVEPAATTVSPAAATGETRIVAILPEEPTATQPDVATEVAASTALSAATPTPTTEPAAAQTAEPTPEDSNPVDTKPAAAAAELELDVAVRASADYKALLQQRDSSSGPVPTSQAWGQCGGINTCVLGESVCGDHQWAACPVGFLCVRQDKYYHQCRDERGIPEAEKAVLRQQQAAINAAAAVDLADIASSKSKYDLDVPAELSSSEVETLAGKVQEVKLALEYSGLDVEEFKIKYASGSLAAVSHVTGIPSDSITVSINARAAAPASPSGRRLKQKATGPGVSVIYALDSSNAVSTVDAISKVTANNGAQLFASLLQHDVPFRPSITINGQLISPGGEAAAAASGITTAESTAAAMAARAATTPSGPVAFKTVPQTALTAGQAAASQKATQATAKRSTWKKAFIGAGVALGGLLLIAGASTIGTLVYNNYHERKAASAFDEGASLAGVSVAASVKEQQTHLVTETDLPATTYTTLFGDIIARLKAKAAGRVAPDSFTEGEEAATPYTPATFMEAIDPSTKETKTVGFATDIESLVQPGEQTIKAGGFYSSGAAIVAGFVAAIQSWRVPCVSKDNTCKTLTMDEYEMESVMSDGASMTCQRPFSKDADMIFILTSPSNDPDFASSSQWLTAAPATAATTDSPRSPSAESGGESDNNQCSSPSHSSADSCELKGSSDDASSDAGNSSSSSDVEEIVPASEPQAGSDVLTRLACSSAFSGLHVCPSGLAIRLANKTELLVDMREGSCRWGLRALPDGLSRSSPPITCGTSTNFRPLAVAAAPLAAASVALNPLQLSLASETLDSARQLQNTAALLKLWVCRRSRSSDCFDVFPRCTIGDDITWAAAWLKQKSGSNGGSASNAAVAQAMQALVRAV